MTNVERINKLEALLDSFDSVIKEGYNKVLDAVSAAKKLGPVFYELRNKQDAMIELFNDIKAEAMPLFHEEPIPVYEDEADGQQVLDFNEQTDLEKLKDRAAYVKLLKVMRRQASSHPWITSKTVETVPGNETSFPGIFMVQAWKLFKIRSMAYLEEYFNELVRNKLEWAYYIMHDHKEYVVFNTALLIKEAEAHKV